MTINEKILKLETEISELKKQIQKEAEERNKDWKPHLEERYYRASNMYPDFHGWGIWTKDYDDNHNFEIGFIFPYTEHGKQQAIELGKKMYYKQWFESLSDVTEDMWIDNDMEKWYAFYDYSNNSITPNSVHIYRGEGAHFTSKEKLEQAISIIGEDNFLKYVLGVK